MGPKRRSTEGAGSSSSSLLHKVSRTPGEKGHKDQITDQTNCGEQAFFEKEKACKSTINRIAVVTRTAEATRLLERTVCDMHKEHVAHDGQLLTPVKMYTASRILINPDTFDREAILRLMHAS